jgi:NAD(P) transhydrogenase subunit alpha
MIESMKKGSIVIDIAAEPAETRVDKNNESIIHNGVTIVGNSALPSSMPYDASKLYGKMY